MKDAMDIAADEIPQCHNHASNATTTSKKEKPLATNSTNEGVVIQPAEPVSISPANTTQTVNTTEVKNSEPSPKEEIEMGLWNIPKYTSRKKKQNANRPTVIAS